MSVMKESKIVFGLDDIQAVRYRCGWDDCKAEVVRPLNECTKPIKMCPSCNRNWTNGEAYSETHELLQAMQTVLVQRRNPVRLRFELDGKEE